MDNTVYQFDGTRRQYFYFDLKYLLYLLCKPFRWNTHLFYVDGVIIYNYFACIEKNAKYL